jgi:hypothetical protein
MSAAGLPNPKEVCDLFHDLLGREVTSSAGAPVQITLDDPAVVAVYVDDNLRMYGLVLFDVPLAAFAGAALALVPPGGAEDAAQAKALTPALAENVSEILNIATAMLAAKTAHHLRLHCVYQADEPVPADVAALASLFGSRVDLTLAVAGYGSGQISIVLAS